MTSAATTPRSDRHRSDIDGLRAFAIGIVVGFHASFPGFEGGFVGVDVFFVISGFLITGVLLREVEEHERVRLGRFWARRIRRLLPASTLVVVATIGATMTLLSPITWQSTAEAGAWAAAYAENLFLAVEEADYFAIETRNPFVHFWSLAIEEQFYVIWPLLMVGLTTAARRLGRPRLVVGGLALVCLASFVHSIDLTGSETTWSYYSPLSRAWEFAAGGLLAMGNTTVRRHMTPQRAVAATGVGAALIGYSLLTLDSFTPFPGWRAVPPVIGTALIIAANNDPRSFIGRLLDLPPVQWVGRLSYGWYLWHFPFLVIAEQYSQSFGPVRRLFVVLAALGAAAISYAIVENPVRHSAWLRDRNWRNYAVAVGLLAISLAVAAWSDRAGADRLDEPRFAELEAATIDFERIEDQGCPSGAGLPELETSCVWGDPDGSATLLVLGDSHADQWIPALDRIGETNGIRVLIRTVVACPAFPNGGRGGITERCSLTQIGQLELIDDLDPDAVLVTQWTGSFVDWSETVWVESVTSAVQGLAQRDIGLVWVHDPPSFAGNPIDCLGIRSESSCTPSRTDVGAATAYHAALVGPALTEFGGIEFTPADILCGADVCPLRFDGDLVYRDSNHLTGTTAAALADDLEPTVLRALGR